jgi:hypothetical protein
MRGEADVPQAESTSAERMITNRAMRMGDFMASSGNWVASAGFGVPVECAE